MGSFREVHERIEADIRRVGRSIMICGAGETSLPFAYTIGNSRGRFRTHSTVLPELLVIGTTDAGFLNNLSVMMIEAEKPFVDGQLVQIPGGRLPVKIVKPHDTVRAEYTLQATEHFGHDDYEVLQVVMPDLDGVFPDEPGCKAPYSRVPILRAE